MIIQNNYLRVQLVVERCRRSSVSQVLSILCNLTLQSELSK